MKQDMIKKIFSGREGEEKKIIRPAVVWVILGAILFLAISGWGEKEKPEAVEMPESAGEESVSVYLENLELRLQKTLEKIRGAGAVTVFLNLEDGGEEILATDRIQKSREEEGDGGAGVREEESGVVRWNRDGIEVPYKVKERLPEPSGILVVAEGAAEESVRQEIYEAVRAIFGLPAHRIKITN